MRRRINGRYVFEVQVIPGEAWYGSKADKIAERAAQDPVILERLQKIAAEVDPRRIPAEGGPLHAF